MRNTLTKRIKVLLGVLAFLIAFALYYFLLQQPLHERQLSIESKQSEVEASIQLEEAKNLSLAKMKAELEDLQQQGGNKYIPMAQYDNAQNVILTLDSVLKASDDYDLSFSPIVTDSGIVRRSVGMSFRCESYQVARNIINSLYSCPYRCLIDEASISTQLGNNLSGHLASNRIQVNLTATFFEITDTVN